MIKVNVGNQYINSAPQEYYESNHEFAGIKNVTEIRKAIQGFNSKTNRNEEYNSNKENEPYQANQSKLINFSLKEAISSPPFKTEKSADNFHFDMPTSTKYKTVSQAFFIYVFLK